MPRELSADTEYVYWWLWRLPWASAADIARVTGLKASAVSNALKRGETKLGWFVSARFDGAVPVGRVEGFRHRLQHLLLFLQVVLRRVLPAVEAQGCLLVDAAQLVGELHHLIQGKRVAGKPLSNRRRTCRENRWKTAGKPLENRWKTAGRPLAKPLENCRETVGKTAGKPPGDHWQNRRKTVGKLPGDHWQNCRKIAGKSPVFG